MTPFVVESVDESKDDFNKWIVTIRLHAKKTFLQVWNWRVSDEKQFAFVKTKWYKILTKSKVIQSDEYH